MVTGGLGFIGSAFVRRCVDQGISVLNLDAFTYAAHPRRLEAVDGKLVETLRVDVASGAVHELVRRENPKIVVHFAAESHVTRSERAPSDFFRSNVLGTTTILDAAEMAGADLVVHVSTDEVYGPCYASPYREDEKEPGEGRATSAYARSKALADDVALSYKDRVPVVVVRPTNCYGPWQHAEKAIARWAIRAIRGDRLPVWGSGDQVRDWMFVEDAVTGIQTVMERGTPGRAYNVAPTGESLSNFAVASLIAAAARRSNEAVYLTEYDRPGHDHRYAVDTSRLRELGWEAAVDVARGIESTVDWYRSNEDWWSSLLPAAESIYADASARRPRP